MGGFGSNLGLYFEIAADPSNAEKALKDFQTSAASTLGMTSSSFGLIASDIESKFGLAQGSLVKVGLAARAAATDLAYIGGIVGVVGGALFAAAEKAAHFAEQVGHVSEKSGATAEQVSTLKFAADRVGVSFEAVDRGLGFLAKNLGNLGTGQGKLAAQALVDIGGKALLAEAQTKPLSAVLPEIVTGLGKLTDGGVKTADSVALFGRGGKELIPVLNEMRQGFDTVERQARSMGLVIGDDDVRAARVFLLEQRTLTAELQSFALAVGRDVMPVVTQLFIRLENYPILLEKIGYDFLRLVAIAASVPTLGASLTALPLIQAKISEKTKEMDQAITNALVKLDAEAKAALAAGIEIDKHAGITDKAAKAQKVWTTDLSALNTIYRELHGTLDPITQANEKYRQILERIGTATGPAYNATLLEKMALEQRDSTIVKAFIADQEEIDKKISKHVPNLQALAIAQTLGANAQLTLTAAQRAGLPVEEDETNALARILANSRAAVDEMNLGELPARQRINIAIDRQIEAADREILAKQRELMQGKITLAQFEAAEQQYTNSYLSLSKQRQAMLKQEVEGVARQELQQMRRELELTRISFVNLQAFGGQAFMALSQGMGSSIADSIVYQKSVGAAMAAALKSTLSSIAAEAIVRAIEATALGFLRLAEQDYVAAGQAFTSAAVWGTIGGVAAAVGAAVPGGGTQSATAAASPGGAVAAGTSAGPAPALAPGAASAAASGQPKEPTAPTPIYITILGDYLATPQAAHTLISVINDAVLQRDEQLHATRTLKPAYAVR